jgi:hypothetical protein
MASGESPSVPLGDGDAIGEGAPKVKLGDGSGPGIGEDIMRDGIEK